MTTSELTSNSVEAADCDRLVEFLVENGRMQRSAIDRAKIIAEQRPSETFTTILVNLGMISNEALAEAISDFTGFPRASLDEIEVPRSIGFLKFNHLFPVTRGAQDALTFAVTNPLESDV